MTRASLNRAPRLHALPLGSVRPTGWMRAQLRRDLTDGFAGCLDALTAHAATDLFQDRIRSSSEQVAWWDSETRGNWLWGYTMTAYLADMPAHKERVTALLNALKNSQDDDGYLGIYTPASRYQHGDEENGELWAQSRALLAMLAYYELTGAADFLRAVRSAVDLTLTHYGPHNPYFRKPHTPNVLTGMTHGLCYADVVEWLYHITGDAKYRDFGVWLYQDFCRLPTPFPNDDMVPSNVLTRGQPLGGHAVHTVEHLRALLFGAPDNRPLIEGALRKLRLYATPSGAVIGDESVHGLPLPDVGYEYCTLTELLFSLTRAAQKLGDGAFGDWMETLVFNAAQGARLPDGSGVSYLTPDTRLAATAERADSYSHLHDRHGRFKFSPTHEDVACCCNPNATRLLPHYISRMWMERHDEPGLVAMAYGPGVLTTRIDGNAVTIVQDTRYPFEDTVRFSVGVEAPTRFALYLRKPAWVTAAETSGTTAHEGGGFLIIEKTWHGDETFALRFDQPIYVQPYPNGNRAVKRGALQFVLPVDHVARPIKSYPDARFHDLELIPRDVAQAYAPVILDEMQPDYGLTLAYPNTSDHDAPWDNPPVCLHAAAGTLVPLGSALLRRADFPLRKKDNAT